MTELVPGVWSGVGTSRQRGMYIDNADPSNREWKIENRIDELRSSWAKLDRAREHRSEFFELLPEDAVEYKCDDDSQTGVSLLSARFYPSVDLERLSLLFGDYVHNLRASLDYAAWTITEMLGGSADMRTEFPLLRNPWNSDSRRLLKRFPTASHSFFDALQPFRTRKMNDTQRALGLLDELNNADKHRALVGVALEVGDTRISPNGAQFEHKSLGADVNNTTWTEVCALVLTPPHLVIGVGYHQDFFFGIRAPYSGCTVTLPYLDTPASAVKRVLCLAGDLLRGNDPFVGWMPPGPPLCPPGA